MSLEQHPGKAPRFPTVRDPEIQAELDAASVDTVARPGGADPQAVDGLLEAKDAAKEAAVKHARHWVRLTRLCNQRCLFCLDSWNHNGTYIDTEQLYQYIDLGVKLGRERLILSGGEPTIHPDYIRFIKRGRKAGYDWIQTVTNGMLFAYPEFARKAIAAGLNEVTVSIHGHTPKLQDRLVGVPGAFDKAIEGIRNIQALGRGRTVINIDVVINKQNVAHLRDIIDYFRGMGIHEFDLLYIVPFGRGFSEYRRQLYFDLSNHFDDLQRAFEVSKEPGVFIWTNRLPPRYLENYEHLIQDPHKLHSEVQGGLHNFEGYLKHGIAPDCHGERCDHCFLKGMCHDHMFAYRERLTDGAFERVRVDLSTEPASPRAAAVLAMQRPAVLSVVGADAHAVSSYLDEEPFPGAKLVIAGAETASKLGDLLADGRVGRVLCSDVEQLRAAIAVDPAAVGGDVQVQLNDATSQWLLDHAQNSDVARWLAAERLVGELPNFEYLSEVRDNAVDPARLRALAGLGLRLMNVAPCLGGTRAEAGSHFELALDMLDAEGNLGVTPYVQRYIMGEYYKKSLRCDGCPVTDRCKGMHINFLRAHSFSCLKPLAEAPGADG